MQPRPAREGSASRAPLDGRHSAQTFVHAHMLLLPRAEAAAPAYQRGECQDGQLLRHVKYLVRAEGRETLEEILTGT